MTRLPVGPEPPPREDTGRTDPASAASAPPDEYRYRPWVPGACPEHPRCMLIRCQRFGCLLPVHVTLGRGRPARFCSARCRVAEYRRLAE